ncbi:MAG: hypothetical protein WBG53_09150 [Rhodococcus sp. (in: high G+C Gram-positive bacteria)]|uniref:hypothetical protein n=1 Tax=unclassified Rhodococcus (in: high G+C Gram-positive bacteria) TaxID=192944 RepID=UPI000EF8E6BF|nr:MULTISPECIES: hypothetical protein [unclassified Rhodococcus (in: high G+C Gram-positive bacteria)]RMB75499.1 hypothetical protein AYK61_01705 [Rhodococcus sp. SBT000017]
MTLRRGTTSIAARSVVAVASAAALLAVLGACSTDTTNIGSSSTTTVAPTTTVTAPPADAVITDAQKQQLCTDLEAQLSNWRVQGPTLGRGGLNILVQTWAAQSGVINLQVVQNRAIVDDITTETCSDVRDEAIRSLDIPDLASGLVGF